MQEDVLGVHERDDAVERGLRLHLVVHEEGLRDRAGVGHAGRLDQDVVELVAPLHQVAEDADQVAAHGAADAAVVHLEDFFLGVDDQVLIDADLAELVLDDGDALAVIRGEDVVEKRCLARPEEAGQHGDGHTRSRGRGHKRLPEKKQQDRRLNEELYRPSEQEAEVGVLSYANLDEGCQGCQHCHTSSKRRLAALAALAVLAAFRSLVRRDTSGCFSTTIPL